MALICTDCFSRLFHYITLNVISYYAGIAINAPNDTEIISVKLKITHSFIKRIRVSNACIMEFRILNLLRDERIPLFRQCLKVNTFSLISQRSFYNHITKQAIHMGTFELSSCGVSTTPLACHQRLHNTQPEYPKFNRLVIYENPLSKLR